MLKKIGKGWRNGSVANMLALQAWEPEFDAYNPYFKNIK